MNEWRTRYGNDNKALKASFEAHANTFESVYLTPPRNRWWVTATGVAGLPPNTNSAEGYNSRLQRSKILKKRQSKENLLTTGIIESKPCQTLCPRRFVCGGIGFPDLLVIEGQREKDVQFGFEPRSNTRHASPP
jgi:hypothetical protein